MAAFHKTSWWKLRFLKALFWGVFINNVTFVSSHSPPHVNRSELIEYLSEDTNVADKLLVGYDKRFIPCLPGSPLEVKLHVVVSDVLKIGSMEAELIIFVRQTWYDLRLSWNSTKRLKIRENFLDKIWLPDIRIVNLKDVKRFDGFGGVNMNIYPDGRIYFSQLVHVKTSCHMDLHRFPLDRQTCFLNFSSFAYNKFMLNFSGSGKKVDVRQHQLPHFELVEAGEVDEFNEGSMSKYTVSLTFQRRAGYYLLQIYIPASFLVVLSWLSFCMEVSNIADRLALEITMILSTVFLLDGINDSIVQVSYAKASDWFVITSFGFIFVALLETMFVYRLSRWEERKTSKISNSATSTLGKQFSVVFIKTDDLGHVEIKLKQQAVNLNTVTSLRPGSNDAVNTTNSQSQRHQTSSEKKVCTLTASCVDKICIVLFPLMYLAFNVGYWWYYYTP